MAEIHLARTTGIGGFEKLLALKVIHPKFSQDQEFIDMLVDEAKIAVNLSHVNVGQIFDLGQVDDVYYIAMEFVDGKDLYQLLVRCSELGIEIPFDIIAFIAKEVAAGLHYAHTRSDNYGRPLNIIHRDVSPQNLLVSYDGQVKIVDFGIAKASQRSRETESGIIKGKFFYMSPEQAWGDTLDGRSDIFSAGICLYEMITGEMLYNEDKALLLLEKVRKAEIPSMRRCRPDVPPALEQIALKALARESSDRYQSGEIFQGALSGFLYSNWPSFNRRRVADFMTQVFGHQRFVLPMPPKDVKVEAPESKAAQSFMEADDFEHVTGQSVIFDLNDLDVEEIEEEDDATVAAAFADEEMQAAFLAQVDGESTMTGDWDDSAADDDQDRTAILDATKLNFGALPPIGEEIPATEASDERTRVFSKQDLPAVEPVIAVMPADEPTNRPPDSALGRAAPIAARASEQKTGAVDSPFGRAVPLPQELPTVEKTSAIPASLLAKAMPQAVEGAAPQRPAMLVPDRATPRIPQADPSMTAPPQAQVKPRSSAPNLAPKRPLKPTSARKETRLKATSARKKPQGGFGRKLLSPAGITVIILSVLLLYGGMAFLPTLFAEPPPQEAVLIIKSSPADAKIIHNGQDTGMTTQGEITGLTVGTEHEIRLELAGYESQTQKVLIPVEGNRNGVRAVHKTLFLVKAAGILNITTEPSRAEVFMDGQFLGTTPLKKKGVSRKDNEFNLLIKLDGYRDYRKPFKWGSKTTIVRNITLRKRKR